MSTPTRDSLELISKSANSIRRLKNFKRSLLTLGGLSKLQRRSITALVQDYWRDNANISLSTSSTQMINEATGIHNDVTASRLTSTDTSSEPIFEQRSTGTTSSSSCGNFSGLQFPNTQLADTQYHDIYEEWSSETDPSNELNADVEISNKFAALEVLDNESDTDNEMSIDVGCTECETLISQYEQLQKDFRLEQREVLNYQTVCHQLTSSKVWLEDEFVKLELKKKSLEDQVSAQLKEQTRREHCISVINGAIAENYSTIITNMVIEAATKQRNSSSKPNLVNKLFSSSNNIQSAPTREEFDKARISLLGEPDTLKKVKDKFQQSAFVPVLEIEEMNKNGYDNHLEKVLGKLIRASLKELE